MAAVPLTFHVVKVVNTGTEILNVPYLGNVTQIPPGESRTVTWDAACGIFGNPYVTNQPGRPERNDSYNATRALWGFAIGYDTETEVQRSKQTQARQDMASSWEAKAPHYEVYTIDTNERIYMVLDDPTGDKFNPALEGGAEVPTTDINLLVAQVAALSAQVAALTNARNAEAQNVPVEPAVEPAPPTPVTTDTATAAIPEPVAIDTSDTPAPKRR